MTGATLTYDEVLKAARRLPPRQRKSLVEDLISASRSSEAVEVVRRLRPAFRLGLKKEKRLSLLLKKGNAGKLSPAERKEVDALYQGWLLRHAKQMGCRGNARNIGPDGVCGRQKIVFVGGNDTLQRLRVNCNRLFPGANLTRAA